MAEWFNWVNWMRWFGIILIVIGAAAAFHSLFVTVFLVGLGLYMARGPRRSRGDR